jgi:succinylglutamate desuccinylase
MADHVDPTPVPTALRVHAFHGLQPGPKLLVLGAVHGNETCGTHAIARLLSELDSGRLRIARGLLTVVPITNPLAYAKGQRTGDRNLNRLMRPVAVPRDFEDRIANVLCPVLAAHEVLLDLHSFHTPGEPFAMLGPDDNTGTLEPFAQSQAESAWAAHLGPRRFVEGWLDTYAAGVRERRNRVAQGGAVVASEGVLDPHYGVGTTEYMRSVGGLGVTLECGQHDDPAGVDVAWQAITQTLSYWQMADLPLIPPAPQPEVMRLVQVVDRLHAQDHLVRDWRSFDAVRQGEPIGHRHDGSAVCAPSDGWVVFPNPRAELGQEWFYFAQRSPRTLL